MRLYNVFLELFLKPYNYKNKLCDLGQQEVFIAAYLCAVPVEWTGHGGAALPDMAAVCWGETSCAAGAMGPDSGMLTYSQHPDSTRLQRKTQRRETRCLKYGERSRVSSVDLPRVQ